MSSLLAEVLIGNTVEIDATVFDAGGAVAVALGPLDVRAFLQYGSEPSAELPVSGAAGAFTVMFLADREGVAKLRIESTGTPAAAAEGAVRVLASSIEAA